MSGDTPSSVHVLACGNTDRRDDGAAVWATAGGEHVARTYGQLDIEQLLDVPAGTPIVVADTAVGIAPGRVVTLTFDELLANPRGPAPHSSHALPIDQVIGVARQLAAGPVDGLFVGIGGSDFGFGPTPSAAVLEALPEFAAAIDAAVRRLA